MKNSILGRLLIRVCIIVITFFIFLVYNFMFENYSNTILMTLKEFDPLAIFYLAGNYLLYWIFKKKLIATSKWKRLNEHSY